MTYQGELFNTTEYNITVSVNTVVYPLTKSSSVCLSYLEEDNNYTVLIKAINGAGEGASAIIIVQTLSSGMFSDIHSINRRIPKYNTVQTKNDLFQPEIEPNSPGNCQFSALLRTLKS